MTDSFRLATSQSQCASELFLACRRKSEFSRLRRETLKNISTVQSIAKTLCTSKEAIVNIRRANAVCSSNDTQLSLNCSHEAVLHSNNSSNFFHRIILPYLRVSRRINSFGGLSVWPTILHDLAFMASL